MDFIFFCSNFSRFFLSSLLYSLKYLTTIPKVVCEVARVGGLGRGQAAEAAAAAALCAEALQVGVVLGDLAAVQKLEDA